MNEQDKIELMTLVNANDFLAAYVKLMQKIDPDMIQIAQLVDQIRQHGYGHIEIQIVGGKIVLVNQTKGFKLKVDNVI